MLLRLLLGTSTIFLSLVLGAFALAFVGYQSPETLSAMLAWARDLKAVLTNTGSASPKYTIKVLGEAGNTITTANTAGVVAPGTTVVDLNTVLTGFSDTKSGLPRRGSQL